MPVLTKVFIVSSIAAITLLMGIFVIRQKRTAPNIAFFLMCFSAALVSACLVAMEVAVGRGEVPLPWHHLYDTTLAVFLFSSVLFALMFPEPATNARNILIPFGVFGLTVAAVSLAGGNFTEHTVVNRIHRFKPSPFFYIYIGYAVTTLSTMICVISYRHWSLSRSSDLKDEKARNALRTIVVWFPIAIVSGLFFSLVEVVVFDDIDDFYLQTVGFLIYNAAIFYAIVKYNAFDIETVVHKTLSWAVLSSGPLAIGVLFGFAFKEKIAVMSSSQLGLTIGGTGAAIGLYLYITQPFIDQLFDRRKYDLRKALDQIISDLAVLQELRPMAENILTRVSKVLALSTGIVMVADHDNEALRPGFSLGGGESEPLILDPPLSRALANIENAEEAEIVRHWAMSQGYVYAFPLIQNHELLGVLLLGRKKNLKTLSAREISFLNQVCTATTIALSNSLLFERIRELDQQKTKFLSEVAHELSGPLSGMTHIAEGLLSRQPRALAGECSSEDRNIESIRVTASEMKDLVDNLLDLSKIEIGAMTYNFQSMDIASVVQTAVDLALPAAHRKNLKLTVEIDADLPPTTGDKARLRQCLSNLISNAVKYTEAGWGSSALSNPS